MIRRYSLLIILVALAQYLAGCASAGWHRDMPNFQFQRLEWNHIQGPDARQLLDNLCAIGPRWKGGACVIRVVEGGQCIVFSLYSQEHARTVDVSATETLESHELAHCGIGMPQPGGWAHPQ